MKRLSTLLFAIAAIGISYTSYANESYICLYGNDERKISVVYAYADAPVPCEVVYEKNGVGESLWRAENEAGYCETKALELAEKNRGWGWDCAKMDDSATTAEPTNQ